jgi:hypothetical protein
MKFKGMKWWVAFCETMMFLAMLPMLIVCFVGLYPSLLVINKRETGEFMAKQTFKAMVTITSDLKYAFVKAVEEMDGFYEG